MQRLGSYFLLSTVALLRFKGVAASHCARQRFFCQAQGKFATEVSGACAAEVEARPYMSAQLQPPAHVRVCLQRRLSSNHDETPFSTLNHILGLTGYTFAYICSSIMLNSVPSAGDAKDGLSDFSLAMGMA